MLARCERDSAGLVSGRRRASEDTVVPGSSRPRLGLPLVSGESEPSVPQGDGYQSRVLCTSPRELSKPHLGLSLVSEESEGLALKGRLQDAGLM